MSARTQRGQGRSIATIVSLTLVITTTVVLLAFASLSFWQDYQTERAQLQIDTRREAAQLAIALQSPAWNFDEAQIDGLMASTMQNEDVSEVIVELRGARSIRYVRGRDAAWNSVISANALVATDAPAAAPVAALFSATEAIRLSAPPRGGSGAGAGSNAGSNAGAPNDELGAATVVATFRFVRQQLQHALLRTLLAIAISDLLLIAALYLLARTLVLKPLQTLRGHAVAVAGGADERQGLSDLRFRGEFEDLRISLVAMLQLLQLRYEDLKQQQQRYRTLVADMLRVQDTERRHIGRELHDSAGQILAALEITLELLKNHGLQPDADSARLLEEAAALAKQCHNEIRTTSYLLHPPLLDELGLATALEWLAGGFRERSRIALQISVPARMERLPDAVELALFRVAQEALSNVYRHSEAGSASIRLSGDAESVRLEISDTGKGFDTSSSGTRAVLLPGEVRHGVGLAGMRERMEQIGGELAVRSDSHGTTVTATVAPRA